MLACLRGVGLTCRCAIGNVNLKEALRRQAGGDVTFKVRGRWRARGGSGEGRGKAHTRGRARRRAQIRYAPYVLHPEVPPEGIRKGPKAFYCKRVAQAGAFRPPAAAYWSLGR